MIEVFKTNVSKRTQADMLLGEIHKTFIHYSANFDLEDCDNILRIKCTTGLIHPCAIISLLNDFGFHAEVLPDETNQVTAQFRQFNKIVSSGN